MPLYENDTPRPSWASRLPAASGSQVPGTDARFYRFLPDSPPGQAHARMDLLEWMRVEVDTEGLGLERHALITRSGTYSARLRLRRDSAGGPGELGLGGQGQLPDAVLPHAVIWMGGRTVGGQERMSPTFRAGAAAPGIASSSDSIRPRRAALRYRRLRPPLLRSAPS